MQITLVGVGLVGRAWAISFARAGHTVTLWARRPGGAQEAIAHIAGILPTLREFDLLNGRAPADILAALHVGSDLETAVGHADYVQESTAENLDSKKTLFARLDQLAPQEAILASSTSAILPSLLSANLAGRARCLVVHPINPPYLIPAVEVVPAPWTSTQVVEQVRRLLLIAGQTPIVMKREVNGFLMNRLQGAVLDEAFRLVADGYASSEDVDIGLRDGLGLRWSFMGPFETIDLNSPGGVREYVERYQTLYAELFKERQTRIDWDGDVLEQVARDRRERLSLADLEERRRWRDCRLAALIAHKRQVAKKILE